MTKPDCQIKAPPSRMERHIARTINSAVTYGQLERLAGIKDRVSFWKEFGTDDRAGRERLVELAKPRIAAAWQAEVNSPALTA